MVEKYNIILVQLKSLSFERKESYFNFNFSFHNFSSRQPLNIQFRRGYRIWLRGKEFNTTSSFSQNLHFRKISLKIFDIHLHARVIFALLRTSKLTCHDKNASLKKNLSNHNNISNKFSNFNSKELRSVRYCFFY